MRRARYLGALPRLRPVVGDIRELGRGLKRRRRVRGDGGAWCACRAGQRRAGLSTCRGACGCSCGAAVQKSVGFYHACRLATWPGRERTSSAVLDRSAATWLGIQLDSSPLVLVAEVSPLLALRPRPIVSVLLCVCSLRARGEGTVRSGVRSHARGVCHWQRASSEFGIGHRSQTGSRQK